MMDTINLIWIFQGIDDFDFFLAKIDKRRWEKSRSVRNTFSRQ